MVSISFDKQNNILNVDAEGEIEIMEFLKAFERIAEYLECGESFSEIWNLEKANLNFEVKELLWLAQEEQHLKIVKPGTKSAIITNSKRTEDTIREYEILAKEVGYDTRIVHSREIAFEWITQGEES